jgi:hypothetical protein
VCLNRPKKEKTRPPFPPLPIKGGREGTNDIIFILTLKKYKNKKRPYDFYFYFYFGGK